MNKLQMQAKVNELNTEIETIQTSLFKLEELTKHELMDVINIWSVQIDETLTEGKVKRMARQTLAAMANEALRSRIQSVNEEIEALEVKISEDTSDEQTDKELGAQPKRRITNRNREKILDAVYSELATRGIIESVILVERPSGVVTFRTVMTGREFQVWANYKIYFLVPVESTEI